MLKRIFRYFTGIGLDEALQSRASQFREIVRDLHLNGVFPEIFKDVQRCSLCKKSGLLLVHPNMICYSCFIDAANEAPR